MRHESTTESAANHSFSSQRPAADCRVSSTASAATGPASDFPSSRLDIIRQIGRRYLSAPIRGDANLFERFASKLQLDEATGCWLWLGCRSDKGKYGSRGHFRYYGKLIYAYRAAWLIFHGAIPEQLVVMHTCDNPQCVNPHHLRLGTHKDNIWDSIHKGRWAERWTPRSYRRTYKPEASNV